jgi:hypothetical protein
MLHELRDRFLKKRRSYDEPTALRKSRTTEADLRVWRRDPLFREEERAAIMAPRPRHQFISLASIPVDGEVIDGYRAAYDRARATGDFNVMREVAAELQRLGVSVTDEQQKGN